MPELPDVEVYVESLRRTVGEQPIEAIRLQSPFLLRTVEPPLTDAVGRTVRTVERIGKRIVLGLDGDLYLVLHLMIAGRLRWRKRDAKVHAKMGLMAVDFPHGTLMLTEAAKKKRASLHVISGRDALAEHDPGGVEPLTCDADTFRAALTRENRTLKRALTDPRIFSGIGNAYSDEILHRARLSPARRSQQLDPAEVEHLRDATHEVLVEWVERHRATVGEGFPDKVTAFHDEMAVHGKYGQPCPRCGTAVQRIVYAENESNYCPECQTGGKLLADRALSRLFRGDWPKTLEEMESLTRHD